MLSWSTLKHILLQMWQRKLRTCLSLFGIMWGTLAVLLLLAIGNGFSKSAQRNFQSVASGLLVAHRGFTSIPYQGRPQGQPINITADEVLAFAKQHPHAMISPLFGGGPGGAKQLAVYQSQHANNIQIIGVDSNFSNIVHLKLTRGSRFISRADVNQYAHVTIISDNMQQSLFKKVSAIGHSIMLGGIPFHVIGVSAKDQQFFEGSWDLEHQAIIPYSTYIQTWGNQSISKIYMLPNDVNTSQQLRTQTRNYFSLLKHFSPLDKPAFDIPDNSKQLKFIHRILLGIRLFLVICGGMTLAVGGINIANMMFLIISERTREIGLYMALGAKTLAIKAQVLFECLVMVLSGGLLGLLAAYTIVGALNRIGLPNWLGQPSIDLSSMLVITVLLVLISIVAGLRPAQHAAAMPPVEALSF